jgi:HEAT repeat protein
LLPFTHGLAAIPSTSIAESPSTKKAGTVSIESILRKDLRALRDEKRTDFRALVDRWDSVYGRASAPALRKIALDAKAPDSDRYVAILAHTRIQGPADLKSATKDSENLIERSLQEKNWMLRSAGLKSAEILGARAMAPKVLTLLEKDPALVIRTQAIETLTKLRPEGLADALLKAAMDSRNYRPADFRKGRADWVPQKALDALRDLKPAGYSAKLLPLLNEAKDGRVRAHALHTIETLENKSLKKGRPFAERATAWNQALNPSSATLKR